MATPSPSSPPPKPLIEQVTEVAVNLLLVGSGGYALYNLIDNDIRKALISGAIAAIASLGSSFGAGLMETLQGKWKERGKQLGEAVDKPVDRAINHLAWSKQRYLEALKHHCYNVTVEGLKGYLPRLAIEEVYVPLRVDTDPQRILQRNSVKNVWELLPRAYQANNVFPYRLLAVLAAPGYGKTTLSRYLTLSYANQTYQEHQVRELLPVLLLLREIHPQIQTNTAPTLPELIVQQVQKLPRCQDLRSSTTWFKERLDRGEALIIFDGLDEVPVARRETVSRWLNWQMQNYPSQFMLTSRPHGFDSSLFEGVQQVEILDFTNQDKRDFIDKWYRFITWELKWKLNWEESQHKPAAQRLSREQARAESDAEAQKAADDLSRQLFADKALTELAKNPLLITILAATHEAFEQLPRRRAGLYQKIFNLMLEDRPNRRETRLTLPNAEDNQVVLQTLALQLVDRNETQFTPQQGAIWIQTRLAEQSVSLEKPLPPRQFLQEIQTIAGLLAGGEGDLYEFTHKTFQEYLAAVELKKQERGEWLLDQLLDPNWQEVICFYAALTSAKPFIDRALEQPSEPALKLSQRLMQESKRIDEETRNRLQQALQQLLPSPVVQLEQTFSQWTVLDNQTAITSNYITWGDYQLFLADQTSGQFHSWATVVEINPTQINQPIINLSWADARWFCAWLATQSNLNPDNKVYDYRLPTAAEISSLPLQSRQDLYPSTNDPNHPGNALLVVRQELPERYRSLLNYLATGRWKEADEDTLQVMLEVTNQKEQDYFSLTSLKTFPCFDLRIIDQLWVKYSGGKFGFSVQKQLWVEVGGKLDFGEDENAAWDVYHKMIDRNGWRVNNKFISHDEAIFDTSAPRSHLPFRVWERVEGAIVVHWLVEAVSSLASRLVKCNL